MTELAVRRPVAQVSETLGDMGQSASRIKSSVSEAVEDNLHNVRRAVRKGWYGAHDLVDNAAFKVKRHPFQAIGITAGAAFATGLIAGLAAGGSRRRKWR
jgi:ElaB/YqjD/DUF883 family membrane-anchored ribosome-binding protein